jgi:hypothetical protein
MAMRLRKTPLPGRRMAAAAFDERVGLAPLDVLVLEEPVVVGAAVCGGVVNVISNEDGRDREGGAEKGPRGEDRKRTYR